VLRKVIVELMSNLVQFVEASPRYSGEVVVLVMKADIIGKNVGGAIVREGLGDRGVVVGVALFGGDGFVYVVLGDEVGGEGMQRTGKERAHDEVGYGVGTEGGVDEVVESTLDEDVEPMDPSEGDPVDEHGAEGVEENLEGGKEGLAEDGVKENGFEGGGEVGVETIDAKGLVVS